MTSITVFLSNVTTDRVEKPVSRIFTYTLLVLAIIESVTSDGQLFMPSVAAEIAITHALLGVRFPIFVIHHVSRSI